MNVDVVSPLLLPFLAVAFVVFEVAGALMASIFRRGSVQAGRALSLVVWLLGSGAVAFLGYRQYGLASVAPAAIAAGLSVAIVYAATRRGASRHSWPVAAAMVSVAALAATITLPLSLLLVLEAFGIDGP
jgi:hypothetical protein